MEFTSINTILSAIKSRLDGLGCFSEIRSVCISGYDNLFTAIPDIAQFPAAIVTFAGLSPQENGIIREGVFAVIVIDEFRSSAEDPETFCMLDKMLDAFEPAPPGAALDLAAGVHLMSGDLSPLELDSVHTAWLYELKTTSSFTA